MMDDASAVGVWIMGVGAATVFGTTSYALVAGVSAGPYGSIPAAVVVSAVGIIGLLLAGLAISGRRRLVDPIPAQTSGIACCGASIMLANPLSGTPLPFGQLGLVAAALMATGGVLTLAATIATGGAT